MKKALKIIGIILAVIILLAVAVYLIFLRYRVVPMAVNGGRRSRQCVYRRNPGASGQSAVSGSEDRPGIKQTEEQT